MAGELFGPGCKRTAAPARCCVSRSHGRRAFRAAAVATRSCVPRCVSRSHGRRAFRAADGLERDADDPVSAGHMAGELFGDRRAGSRGRPTRQCQQVTWPASFSGLVGMERETMSLLVSAGHMAGELFGEPHRHESCRRDGVSAGHMAGELFGPIYTIGKTLSRFRVSRSHGRRAFRGRDEFEEFFGHRGVSRSHGRRAFRGRRGQRVRRRKQGVSRSHGRRAFRAGSARSGIHPSHCVSRSHGRRAFRGPGNRESRRPPCRLCQQVTWPASFSGLLAALDRREQKKCQQVTWPASFSGPGS